MSQLASSSLSCKSCSTCQEIMKQLQHHITTSHILSGPEGIIGNVIVNLLSLLVEEANDVKQLNQTVPVISKPPDKQISVVQQGSNPSNIESARTILQTFSNDFTANQVSSHITSSEIPTVSQIIPLNTETKVKDDHQQPQMSQSSKTLQQISNLLEFPLMLTQGSEGENVANSLVNADGTLTSVGISLLLSNQSNRVNTEGKSDLDDVADILVNKMPIPSLKGLDSNFQQLSNFYLQQLVLSQLQAITNTVNTETVVASSQGVTTDYSILKEATSETQGMNKLQLESNDHTGSLQQLLERHKQISGRIDALNTRIKTNPNGKKVEWIQAKATGNNINVSSLSGVTPDLSILTSNCNMPSTSIPRKPLNSAFTEATEAKKALGPVLVEANDTSVFVPLSKADSSSSVECTSGDDVHFSREKKEDHNVNMNNIQNLILETVKRIQPQNTAINKFHENGGQDINVTFAPSVINKFAANFSGVNLNRQKEGIEMETDDPSGNSYISNASSLPKVLYKCDHCGVTFGVLATLTTHIKNLHSDKVDFCNYCQISFTNQEEFNAHLSSHKGKEKIYNCQFCDKVFTSNGDYKKHVIKHTQKRPYSCGHCQKSFRDPGSLAKHERIHTGEQPFICEVCNRGFAEKSSLRKHLRVHSGEKPYKCQSCNKSFSISGNLQRHMLIHTGKRPFKCTVCSKAFNNPSHLRRHIKNLHAKYDDKNIDTGNLVVPRSNCSKDPDSIE